MNFLSNPLLKIGPLVITPIVLIGVFLAWFFLIRKS
jgi:hypothetical protein